MLDADTPLCGEIHSAAYTAPTGHYLRDRGRGEAAGRNKPATAPQKAFYGAIANHSSETDTAAHRVCTIFFVRSDCLAGKIALAVPRAHSMALHFGGPHLGLDTRVGVIDCI